MDGFFPDSTNESRSDIPKKTRGEQSLRPLTVRQLQDVHMPQESTFIIDGVDVTQVTLVGVIRDVNEQATNVTYRIEDGTGSVEVRKWLDQSETPSETEQRHKLIPDTCVRVCARLNSFNNRVSLMAFSIIPLTDMNEISYHFLDAIHLHLLAKQDKDDPMQISPNEDSPAERVYGIIRGTTHDDGIHVDQITRSLQGQYTETEVKQAIDHLTTEGRIYSTIDDYHLRSTEAF